MDTYFTILATFLKFVIFQSKKLEEKSKTMGCEFQDMFS